MPLVFTVQDPLYTIMSVLAKDVYELHNSAASCCISGFNVPFQMGFGSLVCYKGLPKMVLVEASWTSLSKSVSKTILFGGEKGSVTAFLPVTWLVP